MAAVTVLAGADDAGYQDGIQVAIPSWDTKTGDGIQVTSIQVAIPRRDTMAGYQDAIPRQDTKTGDSIQV